MLDRIAQTQSVRFATQYYPDVSTLFCERMLIDEEDVPDFSDTLFSSLGSQPFAFPDPKEIGRCVVCIEKDFAVFRKFVLLSSYMHTCMY